MKVVTLDNEILEKAFDLCVRKLDTQEIYDNLKGDDDIKKSASILQIQNILSDEHAKLLVFHLTGHDGPVREAAAIKINELITAGNKYLDNKEFYTVYADALCDVNPNICRFVVDFLPYLEVRNEFVKVMLKRINNIFDRINNPDIEQKNFLTVRLFNLYWCLEALGELVCPIVVELYKPEIYEILKRSILFSDYTINEKVAKILTKVENKYVFADIINELKAFDNFYVKRYFEE